MQIELLSDLTHRQQEAVQLLGKGLTSKEIAVALGISPAAVDQRIAWAIKKTGVSDRRALAQLVSHSQQLNSEPAQLTVNTEPEETSASEQTQRWAVPEAPRFPPMTLKPRLRLKLEANYVEVVLMISVVLAVVTYLR